ncbi:MAG: helix-turn-helix domain-containing protein [Victivallaceae bacterium]|nr:helix-turn-helix domain-containing protein [Victivallaceae bacterium]
MCDAILKPKGSDLPEAAPGVRARTWRNVPESLEFHRHDFYELVLVRSGSGVHITPEGEYPIHRGNVFLTKPNSFHRYRERHGMDLCNIAYQPDRLTFSLQEVQKIDLYRNFFDLTPKLSEKYLFGNLYCLEEEVMLRADALTREMEREYNLAAPGWQMAVTAAFMQLILLIVRNVTTAGKKKSNTEVSQIGHILAELDAPGCKWIRIPDLAAKSGMTARTLERLFQKTLGISPRQYWLQRRLESAAAELRSHPDDTASEIAARCGFSDSNYFGKCFKQAFGVPPGKFVRKENVRVNLLHDKE